MIRSVAVLGAGNGGCAAAADLVRRGFEVRLYNRTRERIEPIVARGGLELAGRVGEGFVELPVVTDDLGSAVRGADLVMVTAPLLALPSYAPGLAELLPLNGVVFLNPGHVGGGLFLVNEIHRLTGRTDVRTAEVSTLSFACRMRGPAAVDVLGVMSVLPFAAFPGRHQDELLELIRPLYPSVAPATDVLETAFMDINAVEHPPQIICNAGWIEHTHGEYLFYYEGTTPAVGRVIDRLDEERRAVATALGVRTQPFVKVFRDMGYTTEQAAATGSAFAALQESAPNRWIKGPPSLDHRYLHEDVGWGLVPWAELGRSRGVTTPLIDALITLGGALMGRDYRSEGLTLERLGLAGKGAEGLGEYLHHGLEATAAAAGRPFEDLGKGRTI
jgi:opine dehydrogenase